MKKENKIFILAVIFLITILIILIINSIITPKKGELLNITYSEIQKKIENKDNFVLIVSQSTCSHCASYKPKMEIIAQDYGLNIYYIDYDLEKEQDQFLSDLKLSGATPTTLFFEKGKEKSILNRLEGDVSNEKIIEKLKEMGFIKA